MFLVTLVFRIQVGRPDAHTLYRVRGCLALWQGMGLLRVRPELKSQLCHSEQWFLEEISNLLL